MSYKLKQYVSSVQQELSDNEQFSTLILSNKLEKCAEAYPQDKTIGMLSRVIKDLNDNKTYFIRRAELKQLGNQFHSHYTKFGELFEQELGVELPEPSITSAENTIYQRDDKVSNTEYQVEDQILANALNNLFDNAPLKLYSQPVADKALKSVGRALDSWNLNPNKLSIEDGNDKFIIIKANYETPKGITSFYVPTEVNKNNVIDPNLFMGNEGPSDLNHSSIKSYITSQAGVKTKIGAGDILLALTAAASDHREVSAAELAVIRLNASRKDKSEFFTNQVVGLTVEASAKEDVKIAKLPEAFSFEKEMSNQGLAEFKHKEKVKIGRENIARQLKSFGFNAQVVVSGFDDSNIFYGVSVPGQTAFTVPMKVINNKLCQATVLLCDGSISSFDEVGVKTLINSNKTDIKVAAVASNMATLKPSEVIDNLRQAIAEENHIKAEDALNVLANCGDEKAYQTGWTIYLNGLNNKVAEDTCCSKMIKSANSQYPICSHTGLAVNKVFQDKDGNCRPLYRKGMNETYEGSVFMNAKIFA
jgi:hypothetical protein